MDPRDVALLRKGSAAVGHPLTEAEEAGLARYLDLLLHWNRRINLTAVRDPAGVVERHFVDSLAVVRHLPAGSVSLVDVGSGAGFPGAVVALASPEIDVTLVEANHKKAAFLSALCRELRLTRTRVIASRLEQLLATREQFDVAISRATWSPPEWLEKGRALVRPGGMVMAMEGSERHVLPPAAARVDYQVGSSGRGIVILPI